MGMGRLKSALAPTKAVESTVEQGQSDSVAAALNFSVKAELTGEASGEGGSGSSSDFKPVPTKLGAPPATAVRF